MSEAVPHSSDAFRAGPSAVAAPSVAGLGAQASVELSGILHTVDPMGGLLLEGSPNASMSLEASLNTPLLSTAWLSALLRVVDCSFAAVTAISSLSSNSGLPALGDTVGECPDMLRRSSEWFSRRPSALGGCFLAAGSSAAASWRLPLWTGARRAIGDSLTGLLGSSTLGDRLEDVMMPEAADGCKQPESVQEVLACEKL